MSTRMFVLIAASAALLLVNMHTGSRCGFRILVVFVRSCPGKVFTRFVGRNKVIHEVRYAD